jgi:hypothetical protein
MPPVEAPVPPLDPNTMQGAMAEAAAGGTGDMAQTTLPPEVAGMAPATGAAPIPPGMASESSGGFQHKSAQSDEFDKSEMAIERWSEILSRGIERVVERQQRVVLEKASSSKSKKALMSGTLDLDSIFSIDTWNKQLEDDLRPVISAIVNDSYEFRKESYSQKGLKPRALSPAIVKKHIDSQISEILTMNSGIRSSMEEMMMKSFSHVGEEQRFSVFREELVGMYANILAKDQLEISESEAKRAWTFGQVA